MRKGPYGKEIPDGECGAYWADEGGEWMCRRPLGHRGGHSINVGIEDGYPFGRLDPKNPIDQSIVKAWNRGATK